MASVGRWIGRVLGGLVALVLAALGVIYVMSQRVLSRTYGVHEVPVTLHNESASLARGAHLARISCYGCHGDSLQGRVFFDVPMVGRVVAPNALEGLASYSDAQFAGLLRYGVRPNGTSPFIMPPPGMYHLSDADMGALIAYLRTLRPAATPVLPTTSYRPLGRLGMVMGQFKTANGYIDTTVARVGADSASAGTRMGEYFARMICTSCHGGALTGDPAQQSPSIAKALGYSLAELTTLLRTGTARSPETKLALMAEVARSDLKYLTDEEIGAVHGYLSQLTPKGVPLNAGPP